MSRDLTKPKPGRPRRSAALADRRVTIRLTEAEHELLTTAAGVLPVSDWIRDAAIDAARSKS